MAPDDTTVVLNAGSSPQERAQAAAAAIAALPRSARYRVAGRLASGGMGEVQLARDMTLARDVAIKRLLSARPSVESVTRFLREARIQGRLQHPAIVPVYDLAIDADDRPFFAMKQITGTSLADALRNHQWTRNSLLRAFVDVCLAIELAHTRGVIHRDLKPSNIVLGDFGEVYVLDWGVARILDANDPDAFDDLATGDVAHDAGAVVEEGATLPGAILGTPGYMAPEQMKSAGTVGPAADVYSLGCILFEILAGEPLHARSGPHASTVLGTDTRPSQRVPDREITPELDAMCDRATRQGPEHRYPSARSLGDAVQQYLDGDRDQSRRRELAEHHVSDARRAFARGTSEDDRRDAVRAAGRALALDPSSSEAAELVSLIVQSPPSTLPSELREELDAALRREARDHARTAALGLATFFLFLPVLIVVGVRDWNFIAIAYALVSLAVLHALLASRADRPRPLRSWINAIFAAVLVGTFSRLFGPFVIAPGMACVAMAVSASHPYLLRRAWVLFFVFPIAALLPWGLEIAGVLAPTYSVQHDGFLVTSHIIEIKPVVGELAIAGYIASVVIVIGLLSIRVARLAAAVRVRTELQAWHLRQLVPAARIGRLRTEQTPNPVL